MTKLALGLYSIRGHMKDLEPSLKAVKEMGYDAVEFFGPRTLPAAELKALLQRVELEIVGWHTMITELQGEKLEETIAYNVTLGNPTLVVPFYNVKTKQEWIDFAMDLNQANGKLRPHGISTGYHNHAFEFNRPADGELPWDIVMSNTNTTVIGQLDTGNALEGGGCPFEYLKKYPGRAHTIHLKPFSPKDGFNTMIGQDDFDWVELFKLCKEQGTKEFIVEYEYEAAYEQMEGARLCAENLRKLGL